MGGLISTPNPSTPPPQRAPQPYRQTHIYSNAENRWESESYNYPRFVYQESVKARNKQPQPQSQSQPQPQLIFSKIHLDSSVFNLSLHPFYSLSKPVYYEELERWDSDYQIILGKITNKVNFKVVKIERIHNPCLEMAYELKKAQKRAIYPSLQEKWLFHGTTKENADEICKFNFNWRLTKAHKFGNGVSFSPNSTYASYYSHKTEHNKIMIVAKVLVGVSCIGNEFMQLPDYGCDTSQKGDEGVVIVKYEDNEFLPAFRIQYYLKNEHQKPAWRGRRASQNYSRNSNHMSMFD